jgi:UDP-N-acetylmuramyl tripeptide synthase
MLPSPILSAYHFLLAYLGALIYRFPSHKLLVIGVTGTNGKSSTAEFINSIFEEAGYITALSNSIRVKIDSHSEPSTGRSMPGRFFIQRFFRRALDSRCTVATVEMTSEGVKQHRHRAIAMDALVFTNLAPEHIESHGSLQAYADAKFELGRALARSSKRPRVMVANADDPQSARYLALPVEKTIGFGLTGENGAEVFDSMDTTSLSISRVNFTYATHLRRPRWRARSASAARSSRAASRA